MLPATVVSPRTRETVTEAAPQTGNQGSERAPQGNLRGPWRWPQSGPCLPPPPRAPRGAAHHPLSVVACQLPLRSWSIAQLATLLVPDAVEDAMVTPSTFSWQVTVPPPFSWALIE